MVIHPEVDTGLFYRIVPEKNCDSRNHGADEEFHADGGPIWWFTTACLCQGGYRCERFRVVSTAREQESVDKGIPLMCSSCGTPLRPGLRQFVLVEP